jgi:hypothetical protein
MKNGGNTMNIILLIIGIGLFGFILNGALEETKHKK